MTNKNAWREHFSANAADLIAIVRWAEGWTDEMFKHFLLLSFMYQGRRHREGKINAPTVERLLQARLELAREMHPELYEGGK